MLLFRSRFATWEIRTKIPISWVNASPVRLPSLCIIFCMFHSSPLTWEKTSNDISFQFNSLLFQSRELNWSNVLQGYILGAFITSQIIGGRLADKFVAKYLFGGSIFWAAALNFLVPTAARASPYILIGVLIAQGISQVCKHINSGNADMIT